MFGMGFHACFDFLFSKARRQLRKETRKHFTELANIPADQWIVKISEGGPCFYTDFQDRKIGLEMIFYGFCLDGVRFWCNKLTDEPTNIYDAREYRGSFSQDFHLFNLGPRGCNMAYSGYVDKLYSRLCRRLKKEIETVKQLGVTEHHNSWMEKEYNKFIRSISIF